MVVLRYDENRKTGQLSITNPRLDKLEKVITEVKRHFIPIKNDLVKVPASLSYPDYNFMWNRDSAYGSYYITIFTETAKRSGLENLLSNDINELEKLNGKLIYTLWKYLDQEVEKINKKGYESDIRKLESTLGSNHILARFDIDENGIKRAERDKNEENTFRSWIMQYDWSFIIEATREYLQEYESIVPAETLKLIEKSLNFLVKYMYNFYVTPSADAWEHYYIYEDKSYDNKHIRIGKTIDSYTVSSLYKGIKSAKAIARMLGIKIEEVNEEDVSKFLLNNFTIEHETMGKFLAKSKIELGETIPSIGAEEIEIFNTFRPTGVENLEENTVRIIEKELFDGNPLPIRYKFFDKYKDIVDTYFGRGSWFNLGLQYSMYLNKNGRREESEKIINYVESKIADDGSIPEQEIYDKNRVYDPDHYFERNGNSTIKDLLWAKTAYLAAVAIDLI